MSHPDDTEYGRCQATAKSTGEQCGRAATGDHGKCNYHGGASSGAPEGNQNGVGNDGGAPPKNGNAETHGLTADADQWFERHRDKAEGPVRRLVATWMEHAPFGWRVEGKVQLLCDAAKNEMQIRDGDAYIEEHGLIVDKTVGYTENGREITRKTENPASLQKSRLQSDTIRMLDKLGVLDSPDAQQAGATESFADAVADLAAEQDGDGS